jgi:HEAT repeat protein
VTRVAFTLILLGGPIGFAACGDLEDLRDADAKVRQKAAQRLAGAKSVDPALTAELVERMREDPSPMVRRTAAFALGKVQPTQKLALAALVEVAGDPDEFAGVRQGAIDSLGKLAKGSKRAAEALEKAAADPVLTFTAVQALVRVGAEDKAKAFLEHRDEQVRAMAIRAYTSTEGADVIGFALASKDPEVRLAAVAGLRNRDYRQFPLKPAELAALVPAAADADPKIRASVVLGLTKAGQTSHVIPALVEGLNSENEEVQWTSAGGLAVAGRGVAKYIPELVAAVDKPTFQPVKMGKIWSIQALGEAGEDAKPALPKLYALLRDKELYVRRAAAEALAKAGAADPAETVKQVRTFANDPDADIRSSVGKVIEAFGTNAADLAVSLKNPDLGQAMRALPTVARRGPDAGVLVPDLLALAGRIPPPRPNFAVPDDLGQVARVLAGMGPKATPAIAEGLKSNNIQIRRVSARALEKMGLDALGALTALRAGVGDADRTVRIASAAALNALGYRAREAAPDLIKSLNTHEDSAGAMGEALAWTGSTGDDAKKLIEALKVPGSPLVRRARIYAASGTGKETLAILDAFAKELPPDDPMRDWINDARTIVDRDVAFRLRLPLLRVKAVQAPHEDADIILRLELTADQRKQFVEGLVAALEDRPPAVQVELLRRLRWLGTEAADALPAVEKLLAAPDESVRLAAKWAAKQIKP